MPTRRHLKRRVLKRCIPKRRVPKRMITTHSIWANMEVTQPLKTGWLTPISSKRIRSQYVEMDPGGETGAHVTHHREELVILLEGKAIIEEEGKSIDLEAPASVYIAAGKEHNIKNPGPSPLRYVYVVALHIDNPPPAHKH